MKPHRPEREIQKAIAEYLKARGVLAFRMQTGATVSTYKGRTRLIRYGIPGMADILCFPKGQPPCWIECKSDKGKLSTDQAVFGRLVESEGHRYIVARSVEDVMEEL